MSEDLGKLECYLGIVVFSSVKTQEDILNYVRQFTDAKLIFDKRAIEHLYITPVDPRIKKERGDKHA